MNSEELITATITRLGQQLDALARRVGHLEHKASEHRVLTAPGAELEAFTQGVSDDLETTTAHITERLEQIAERLSRVDADLSDHSNEPTPTHHHTCTYPDRGEPHTHEIG